jgi:hypothetical protein
MRINKRHILLLILLLIILVIILPFSIPYRFESTARLYPQQEWKLYHGQEEGFYSQINDYRSEATADLRHYRFERGDIARLEVRPGYEPNTKVSSGDTLAYLRSWFIENEILRLTNLRDVEAAALKAGETGEKPSLVEMMENKHKQAIQALELARSQLARQKILYEDSVIPASEYEIYENTYKLAEINVQVALKELESVRTGLKTADLDLIRERIATYQKEIDKYTLEKEQYNIISPISGLMSYDPLLGGVLKVSDVDSFVIKIPVLYRNSIYLDRLSSIEFTLPGKQMKIHARLLGFIGQVSFTGKQQYIIAKAVIVNDSPVLIPGMMMNCRINCDRVSLFEYLRRNIMVSY